MTPEEQQQAHDLGDLCEDESCGICEQVREDRQRAEDRDAAYERYLCHGDYLRDLAKDGGF